MARGMLLEHVRDMSKERRTMDVDIGILVGCAGRTMTEHSTTSSFAIFQDISLVANIQMPKGC